MPRVASDNLRDSSPDMSLLRANQALVADEILLDGRLALFHQRERWLAVADLHFGYELSQRAARSEERRVGKECRSRGWPDRYKDTKLRAGGASRGKMRGCV